jgi:hypothetical protein
MRKFLLSASLAGLLLTAGSVWVHAVPAQGQSDQQTKSTTKMVEGKVTAIGNGGHSFTLEINEGGATQTMQFVVDPNVKVQGTVKVGTNVNVEYEPKDGGQNVALNVNAQG